MAPGKRILVTGACGYIAGAFLRALVRTNWATTVIGLDKDAPERPVAGVDYFQADMLAPEWPALIEREKPDALVHLAFVVAPMRDEALMHQINVEGTRRTLQAASAGGTTQVLVASSATAYGAFEDNPLPLCEQDAIRGGLTDCRYAKDKAQVEEYCGEFAQANPMCKLSIIRPVIVFGPNVDNFLSRFVYAFPVVPLIEGGGTPIQFVHEEDVAEVMVRILEQEKTGAFNIAGPEWLTVRELCHMTGRRTVPISRWLFQIVMRALWKMRCPNMEAPETILDFIQYPWVVDTGKVREELGYEMRHSGCEAVSDMARTREKR